MSYYTYKVELNGENVRAELDADFWYEMFQGGTNVSEDVVKQTAQQIYDAVKNTEEKDYINLVIKADFKDDYLAGIIDADYSEDFVPVNEPHYYDEYESEFPYDLKGSRVEYDRYEVERDILNEYEDFYNGMNEYIYENLVEEKLDEMGFDELCEQKGVEVEIEYDYDSLNISYYDGLFNFKTYVKVKFYERYDDE